MSVIAEDLFTNEALTYARGGADVSLSCGQNYVAVEENFAATCTQNDAGDYCFNILEYQFGTDESNRISEQIMMSCSPIATAPDSGCSEECHSALLDLIVARMSFLNCFQ